MDEPRRWGRTRYAALLGVLAAHLAVLTSLLIAAKTPLAATPIMPAIELLILPQTAAPAVPPRTASPDRPKKLASIPYAPPTGSLTMAPLDSDSDEISPPIDWALEAHDAAASIINDSSSIESKSPTPFWNSSFSQPSLHHKGEQIPTTDGRWIVFVSDNCYQLSQSITAITNATNTGVGIQTYCTRQSKTARGDLFEQLPAYKKLHTDH
jgi:hypothetical protein